MKYMKKMKWIDEFKEFISRGNVMDLAVGIIIGSAFTAIVTSFVNDILMPVIGLLLGKINFTNLKFVLVEAKDGIAEVAIYYGNFLQRTIDFLLTAFAVFLLIKLINNIHRVAEGKKKKEEKQEEKKEEEYITLLKEIRDSLKEKKGEKEPTKPKKKKA